MGDKETGTKKRQRVQETKRQGRDKRQGQGQTGKEGSSTVQTDRGDNCNRKIASYAENLD